MKSKAHILIGTLMLTSQAFAAIGGLGPDGNVWRSLSPLTKAGYVMGFETGLWMMRGWMDMGDSKTPDQEKTKIAEEEVSKLLPKNLEPQEIVNRLDRFYDEPLNREIAFTAAMQLLAMRMHGFPESDVQEGIRRLRNSQDRK